MLRSHYFILSICVVLSGHLKAQEITIGTRLNTVEAFESYTLFAPFNSFDTYLVDNCGEVINIWQSDQRLAASVYLTDQGELVRTYKVPSAFFGGGSGGGIEIFSWEGERLWEFEYAGDNVCLHHDVEILPNGNILAIAWEYKSPDEAISKGKVGTVPNGGMWPDHIIEIQRGGANDKEIVWSWHAWDHLIQDVDPAKPNYGAIDEFPERVNINIYSIKSDWIHFNSIDYNEDLDQILLSSRHFSEIWIIDHSTTTEEAASSFGGQSGKGGDILFRWGNPFAYKAGNNFDQVFFGQHDAEWIHGQDVSGDQIIVFNNGETRSSIQIIEPAVDNSGNYSIGADGSFLPDELSWMYDGGMDNSFYSGSISGTASLPNNNILIASGEEGRIFEINIDEEIVWDYIVPVGPMIFSQGATPSLNQIFKSEKYDVKDPIFEGKDVSPQGPLELNPIEGSCQLLSGNSNLSDQFYFNYSLVNNQLLFDTPFDESITLIMTSLTGQNLGRYSIRKGSSIELTNLIPGLYILHFYDQSGHFIGATKLMF